MSDNTQLNTGTGGDTIATDDVTLLNGSASSGVKVQRAKVGYGDDNSYRDVSELFPMPVTGTAKTNPLSDAAAQVVRQAPSDFWRVGFALVGAGVPSSGLSLVGTGSGQTVNQSGGNLVLTSGTTANAESLIVSDRSFRGSFLFRFGMQLSQRIANQNFIIELADKIGEGLAFSMNSTTSVTVTFPTSTNPFTTAHIGQTATLCQSTLALCPSGRYAVSAVSGDTVTFTVVGWPATGTGTLRIYGRDSYRVLYDGTSATSTKFDAGRKGWFTGDTTITVNTSAAPGHVVQIAADNMAATVSDGLQASATAFQFAQRGSRNANLPDDNAELYLHIRMQNGSTAPASTTTWTVFFVLSEANSGPKVRLASVDPAGAAFALAVNVLNTSVTVAANQSGTWNVGLNAGTNLSNDVGQQYRASATGAASGAHIIAGGTSQATVVKASAGKVIGWSLSNMTASWRFVKLHNLATTPTAGAAVARTIGIPPNGVNNFSLEGGIAFSAGIGYTLTTGIADTDTTGPTAADVGGDLYFA